MGGLHGMQRYITKGSKYTGLNLVDAIFDTQMSISHRDCAAVQVYHLAGYRFVQSFVPHPRSNGGVFLRHL